jgi:hypothetical protein
VVSLRRRWVIQLGEWVAIQARIPVAAAPVVPDGRRTAAIAEAVPWALLRIAAGTAE